MTAHTQTCIFYSYGSQNFIIKFISWTSNHKKLNASYWSVDNQVQCWYLNVFLHREIQEDFYRQFGHNFESRQWPDHHVYEQHEDFDDQGHDDIVVIEGGDMFREMESMFENFFKGIPFDFHSSQDRCKYCSTNFYHSLWVCEVHSTHTTTTTFTFYNPRYAS